MSARLKVSRAGIDLVKAFEGFRRRAARLPDGRWTVGYGHTLSAREGAEVSESDAEALLIFDLLPVADAVEAAVGAPLTQNQFDALTAFAFNVGLDAFRASSVLAHLRAGRLTEAALALDAWRMVELDGRSVPLDPLVRRRAAEKALFLTPPGGPYAVPSALLRPTSDPRSEAAIPPRGLADVEIPFDGPVAGVRVLSLPEPEPEPEPEPAPPVLQQATAPEIAAAPEPRVAEAEEAALDTAAPESPSPAAAAAWRTGPIQPMGPRAAPIVAPDVAASVAWSTASPKPGAPAARPAAPPPARPASAMQLYAPYASISHGPLPLGRPAPREARSSASTEGTGRESLDSDPAPAGPGPAPTPAPNLAPALDTAAEPALPVVAAPLQLPPRPAEPRTWSPVDAAPVDLAPAPVDLVADPLLPAPPPAARPSALAEPAVAEAVPAPPPATAPALPASTVEPLVLTPPPEYDPPPPFGALRDPEPLAPAATAEEPALFDEPAPRVIRHEVIVEDSRDRPEPDASGGGVWWLMAGVGVVAWSGAVAAFVRRDAYYGASGVLGDPTTLAWVLAVIGAACVATAAYFLLKRFGGVKD